MKSKLMIALAATALTAATASFAPPAEAGFGVRLGFGFPLGSFVARSHPRHSYYGGYRSYRGETSRKKPVIARRYRDDDDDDEIVSRKRSHRAKSTAIASKPKADEKVKDSVADVTDAEEIKAVEQTAATATAAAEGKAAPITTAATSTKTVTPESTITGTEKPADKSKSGVAVATTETKPLDCKQFVPTVGITISVPCPK